MSSQGSSRFHTTRWSLIAALPGRGDDRDADRAREAIEHLCRAYWKPLYGFARRAGCSAEDARDLTQAFLTRVIETGGLGGATPERGRFRSYLLGAMKHFMANDRKRAKASKRGGGRLLIDGDVSALESRIAAGPSGDAAKLSQDEADRARSIGTGPGRQRPLHSGRSKKNGLPAVAQRSSRPCDPCSQARSPRGPSSPNGLA